MAYWQEWGMCPGEKDSGRRYVTNRSAFRTLSDFPRSPLTTSVVSSSRGDTDWDEPDIDELKDDAGSVSLIMHVKIVGFIQEIDAQLLSFKNLNRRVN